MLRCGEICLASFVARHVDGLMLRDMFTDLCWEICSGIYVKRYVEGSMLRNMLRDLCWEICWGIYVERYVEGSMLRDMLRDLCWEICIEIYVKRYFVDGFLLRDVVEIIPWVSRIVIQETCCWDDMTCGIFAAIECWKNLLIRPYTFAFWSSMAMQALDST